MNLQFPETVGDEEELLALRVHQKNENFQSCGWVQHHSKSQLYISLHCSKIQTPILISVLLMFDSKICAPSLRRGQGYWGPYSEFKDSQRRSHRREDLENSDYQF